MLSLVGLGGFTLASLVIGVRLGLLARRTRAWPEAMLALAFLSAGALGNLLNALVAMGLPPEPLVPTLLVVARAFGLVGSAALYLFSWRVFRPDARWALALAGAGIALGAATWLGHGLDRGFGRPLTELSWYWPTLLSRACGYGWAAVEALLYWAAMRRRRALGLADALQTHRFLLWGLGASAAFTIFAVNMIHAALAGAPTAEPWLRDVTSCLGLVAAATIWLAFFPPAAYRAWALGGRPDTASRAS